MMKVTKLVVHHSATSRKTTTIEDIKSWHKKRGFSQIGYHKVITETGTTKIGRSEATQGAHAKGANAGSLGVCVIGNYETEIPTAAQLNDRER